METSSIIALVLVAAIALGAGFAFGKLGKEQEISAERARANELQGQVNLLTNEKTNLEQFKSNRETLDQMLKPMRDAVTKLGADAVEAERRQSNANVSLREQIDNMNKQATELQVTQRQLVGALTSSASRGRWGEMQLERLFEYAGMERGVHYFPQAVGDNEVNRGRPDFIVKLPNSGTVYIDSKFPFDAYWQALSSDNEVQRAEYMKAHAKAVKDRVKELSKREYQNKSDSSADFAVLFLPFESLYYTALEIEPNMLTDVFGQNVVIATPSTMMGLLHTVKLGISQANTAENAAAIRKAALDILDRFAVFTNHLNKVDKNLTTAVEALEDLKGSYQRQLLPGIKKMQALGVDNKKAIKDVVGGNPGALESAQDEELLEGEIEE
jgi:DNA recombination protein RmuC